MLAVIEDALIGNAQVAMSRAMIAARLGMDASSVGHGISQIVSLGFIKRIEPQRRHISRYARCDNWQNIGVVEAATLKKSARPPRSKPTPRRSLHIDIKGDPLRG